MLLLSFSAPSLTEMKFYKNFIYGQMSNVGYNVICQRFDEWFLFLVQANSAIICLASVLLKINLLLKYYNEVLW